MRVFCLLTLRMEIILRWIAFHNKCWNGKKDHWNHMIQTLDHHSDCTTTWLFSSTEFELHFPDTLLLKCWERVSAILTTAASSCLTVCMISSLPTCSVSLETGEDMSSIMSSLIQSTLISTSFMNISITVLISEKIHKTLCDYNIIYTFWGKWSLCTVKLYQFWLFCRDSCMDSNMNLAKQWQKICLTLNHGHLDVENLRYL